MPFHFCADELLAIMMLIPFIGIFFRKLHTWYHIKFKHKCHDESCHDTNPEHVVVEPEPISDPEIPVTFDEEEVEDPFAGWRLTIKGFVAGVVYSNGPMSEGDLLAKFHEDDVSRLTRAVQACLADGTLKLEEDKLVFGEL